MKPKNKKMSPMEIANLMAGAAQTKARIDPKSMKAKQPLKGALPAPPAQGSDDDTGDMKPGSSKRTKQPKSKKESKED